MPENAKAFADFSLLIMNISNYPPKAPAPAGVSYGAEVEVPGLSPRLYEDSTSINRGLFALPH